MGKIKSAASGIGGAASNVRSSVMNFEQAPLANAAYLLTIGAICVALPTFIVALVLAINNIGIANQSNMSSARGNFLSAGTLYLESISTPIFVMLFVAALVLFIVYKVKSPVSKGGQSVGYELRIWVMGALFSLVVAPLVLLFAENILTIIIITVACIALFFFLSSVGSGDGGSAGASASQGKEIAEAPIEDKRSVIKANPKKVAIYDMSRYKHFDICSGDWYVEVGAGMHGKDNVRPLCTVEQYKRGKYKFVNRDNGKEFSPR